MKHYDNRQDDICVHCSGSGEGYCEGSTCDRCNGSGEYFLGIDEQEQYHDRLDFDHDEWNNYVEATGGNSHD